MKINSRMSNGVVIAFFLVTVFVTFVPAAVHGHGHGHGHVSMAPVPAPAPVPFPTSDGTAIDQGIAYILMLLALVLTYIIHTFDTPINL